MDFGGIIGAGISTVGNLVGASINNNYAKQQMKLQNELNKNYFDYVSEYNSPFNQVGRLKQAGLNPALAFGGGITNTQSAVGSSTIPSVNYANNLGSDAVNSALSATQIHTQKVQNDNTQADTALKDEQSKTEQSKQTNMAFDNLLKNQDIIAKKLDNAIKSKASEDIIKTYKAQFNLLNQQVETEIQKQSTLESERHKNEQIAETTRQEREMLLPLRQTLISAQISDTLADKVMKLAAAHLSNKQAWQIEQLTPDQKLELQAQIRKINADARKSMRPGAIGEAANTVIDLVKTFGRRAGELMQKHPTLGIQDFDPGPSM